MRTNNSIRILQLLETSSYPLGATQLSEKTGIPSATIGRVLARLEKENKVEKVGNRGRRLTPSGEHYLHTATIHNTKMSVADKLISLMHDNTIERMYEVQLTRRLLEAHTVELAARNATPEDVQTLEDILFDYTYEVRHGNPHSETDAQLHLHIAKMSGNATIHQILLLLLNTDSRYYGQLSALLQQTTGERIEQHRNIVDAIRDRNPERAVLAMTWHLDTILRKRDAQ